MTTIAGSDLLALCEAALLRAGADPRDAHLLAEATVEAERVGNRAVGVDHLFDYLDGYRKGRITPTSRPEVRRLAPAVIDVDARSGLAQTAFHDAADELRSATRDAGLGALWIRNAFTCGELGYYPRRVADHGDLALAVANSPALMSLGGATTSILGTNPVAYGIPRPRRTSIVIDQATSATAFVNIRRTAATGEPIPADWALGPDGQPTTDADTALQGTLLPFGGYRGGNVALLVETLATLSGAAFSLDAPPFQQGNESPRIGVFVLSIDLSRFGGALDRLLGHIESLSTDHQVRLPAIDTTSWPEAIDLPDHTMQRLTAAGRSQ